MTTLLTRVAVPFLLVSAPLLAQIPPAPSPTPTPLVHNGFTVHSFSELRGQVLFTLESKDRDSLWVLDLDARRVRRLVDDGGRNRFGSWAPDGKRFVFTSFRSGNGDLYLADFDGANVTQLTAHPEREEQPDWSRDGSRILFTSSVDERSAANSVSIAADGSDRQQHTHLTGRNTVTRWSPDRSTVTYSTNRFWPGWDLCSTNLTTKKEICLLSGVQTYCRGSYSPDGASIVFSFGGGNAISLGVLTVATRAWERLTDLPGRSYDAIFRPDGEGILFVNDGTQENRFELFFRDGKGTATPLLSHPTSAIRYPAWTATRTIDLEAARARATVP